MVKTPVGAVSGAVDVKVLLANDVSVSASSEFEYFQACAFSRFCESSALVVNSALLIESPPVNSECSLSYCLKPRVYSPVVRAQSP